jgi:hypothetical protein
MNPEVRGESPAVYGGDESDNRATTAGINPPTAYVVVSTTGKNWRLDRGPPGRRRPSHRSREGVSEAVATRQAKRDPRPLVPAHRGAKGRQADGTARARTLGTRRLGASPPSLRDERDARCKRIPRPHGRRTRHTPRGADVSRTNPVSPRRTPFGRREVASGDVGATRCPALESSPFRTGRMSTPTRTGSRPSSWTSSITRSHRLLVSSQNSPSSGDTLNERIRQDERSRVE